MSNEDEMSTAQPQGLSPALRAQVKLANELELIAARRSVTSGFGWAHPDCIILSEAARILKGMPETIADDRADGVLSSELDEPLGLSASEAPGAAAVTPNPPEVS